MGQRLRILCCLFAWFIATGCQWDLAQLVAWGSMFAGNSETMSLSAAAQKTFSGEMCDLCKAVQKGKQEQDENSPQSSVPGKGSIKLLDAGPLSAVAEVVSPARQAIGVVEAPAMIVGRDRLAPPLPPPRTVA